MINYQNLCGESEKKEVIDSTDMSLYFELFIGALLWKFQTTR